MKAFVTSIGEKTTEICCEQLNRFGFEVVLLDGRESWLNKYKLFINTAKEECVRVDADIIPNRNIRQIGIENKEIPMIQHKLFDLYKNNVTIGGVILYRKKALDMIRVNIDKLEIGRTETMAFRNNNVTSITSDLIVGMHGFYQNDETMEIAKKNKIARGQIEEYHYDFDLAFRLKNL